MRNMYWPRLSFVGLDSILVRLMFLSENSPSAEYSIPDLSWPNEKHIDVLSLPVRG